MRGGGDEQACMTATLTGAASIADARFMAGSTSTARDTHKVAPVTAASSVTHQCAVAQVFGPLIVNQVDPVCCLQVLRQHRAQLWEACSPSSQTGSGAATQTQLQTQPSQSDPPQHRPLLQAKPPRPCRPWWAGAWGRLQLAACRRWCQEGHGPSHRWDLSTSPRSWCHQAAAVGTCLRALPSLQQLHQKSRNSRWVGEW